MHATTTDLHSALGLKPLNALRITWENPPDGWHDLGTTSIDFDGRTWATVQVEVYYAPAVFFRFTIRSGIEDVQAVVLETGSGSLADYWPTVYLFATGMVHARPVTP